MRGRGGWAVRLTAGPVAGLALLALLALLAVPSAAIAATGPVAPAEATGTLVLPAPVTDVPALPGVGLRQDRLLTSVVPGTAANREKVQVEVGPGGAPVRVRVEQRVSIEGAGDYQVRERGPARDAVALGDDIAPPVLNLGKVVWQGFSPGRRELGALLTLDAGLEAPRLPLDLNLTFTPSTGGPPQPLGPGGRIPRAGTVRVTLTNTTASPRTLPTGNVAAAVLAGPLDNLRAAALRDVGAPPAVRGDPPPAAGTGLPAALPARDVGQREAPVVAPLRVTGTLSVTGAQASVAGPGISAQPGGAAVAGTLSATAAFSVTADGPARLAVDLLATTSLDPRALQPPGGAASWAAWAATAPDATARQQAVGTLVDAAAAAARSAQFAPYLAADLPGTTSTTFRYSLAAPELVPVAAAAPRLQPGAAALAGVAALGVAALTIALWRLS